MKKLLSLALVLVMAAGLVLTGCGGGSASTGGASTPASGASTPADGGGDDSTGGDSTGGEPAGDGVEKKDSIVFALDYVVSKLDPHAAIGKHEWTVNRAIYESLFKAPQMDYDNLQPWLAESWDVSDDQLEWTFHLRQGVKFHNGAELTSDDVIFSLEKIKTSPTTAAGLLSVSELEKVDDYTFILRQSYPFPDLMTILADYQFGAIMNKALVEEYGADAQEAAVGTGAYKLAEWNADNTIVLEYFEDHWAPEPEIKKVTYRPITDFSAASIAMFSGEVDVINYGLTADQDAYIEDANIDTEVFIRDLYQYVMYNCEVAPFDDVNVRRAINYAIDRDGLNEIVSGGANGTEGATKTSVRMEGYQKALDEGKLVFYDYNPEKAKELLAEAGYDENNPLNCSFITTTSSFAQMFATTVQAQLAAVNINIDIQTQEPALWVGTVAEGNYEMSFGDLGSMPYWSTMSYFFAYTTGMFYNREHYSNPRVDEIAKAGVATTDKAAREEMYAELLNIVTDQATNCPVIEVRGVVASTKGLKVYPEKCLLVMDPYDMHWQ